MVDGIETGKGEEWTYKAREGESELVFELTVQIEVFCEVRDGPRACPGRPICVLYLGWIRGVPVSPHVCPQFERSDWIDFL